MALIAIPGKWVFFRQSSFKDILNWHLHRKDRNLCAINIWTFLKFNSKSVQKLKVNPDVW